MPEVHNTGIVVFSNNLLTRLIKIKIIFTFSYNLICKKNRKIYLTYCFIIIYGK